MKKKPSAKPARKKKTAPRRRPTAQARPKAPAQPTVQIDAQTADRIILLMVQGAAEATIAELLQKELNLDTETATAAITDARRRLTLAADYNRHEQLATAITRLNDCYTRSIRIQDVKTGIAAQRELNKLMGLTQPAIPLSPTKTEESAEAEAIRSHLLPLELAPESAPLTEHVRLAALAILSHAPV